MEKIKYETEEIELKIKVAEVCLSIKVDNYDLHKKLLSYFADFLSQHDPQVFVNIKCGDFKPPLSKEITYQNTFWDMGQNRKQKFLAFREFGEALSKREYTSAIWLSYNRKSVDCYTKTPGGEFLLLGHYPGILYRLIVGWYQGIYLHSCGTTNCHEGKNFLFVGTSNHGKSTLAKLSNQKVINDDRTIIRQLQEGMVMFSPPGYGRMNSSSPKRATVDKVFFLEHAKDNFAQPMTASAAASRLFSSTIPPFWSRQRMRETFDFCTELAQRVPCYKLGFVPDASVWEFLGNFG